MAKPIDENTLSIISRVTVEGNIIFLTCGQLDRAQYKAVNDVLENMGGKWDRRAKGHVFNGDPSDALEEVLLSREIVPPRKYGYFPTPVERGQRVIELAGIKPGMSVGEPQAGQGALADLAAAIVGIQNVRCYELQETNCAVLQKKGFAVQQGDFLSIAPQPLFDCIVMNPPFERQADIDHVQHAWQFVKPGGRLVSIMAASIAYRENKKTIEFRRLLERHGFMENNPAGSFKESGTMVGTVTVVMDKAA